MKKDKLTPSKGHLRREYDLSELKGGVRGKYLDRFRAGTNLALLAPELRAAFPTDAAVNQALRLLMHPKTKTNGGVIRTPSRGGKSVKNGSRRK